MKKIIGYLRLYIIELDKPLFALSACFTALAIFINYYHGLNKRISVLEEGMQYLSWYLVFLLTFSFAYVSGSLMLKKSYFRHIGFLLLLIIAPSLFAWKMSADLEFNISASYFENSYWNQVVYWPAKLLVMMAALWIVWKLFNREQPYYGMKLKGFDARPYIWMLVIMIPLIALASTQPDFQAMYPKLKNVLHLSEHHDQPFYKILYELSYGSDFIGIELFFRGFLVLAFVKYAGKDAILPMAMFYCTIHFGKPLGECISSFFGGLVLGVVTYHTRTIYGGLMVHLGIAWLMELFGAFPVSDW
ncbi:MAG: CPBP family intramembrane glutamic endopeptidase [Flavisolibacter sp.]